MWSIIHCRQGALMGFSKPTKGGDDLPFLVQAQEDEWVRFEVSVESVEEKKNEKGWNCYMAVCRNVRQNGFELAPDGPCEIPFWAMVPFYDAIGSSDAVWVSVMAKVSKIGNVRTVMMVKE